MNEQLGERLKAYRVRAGLTLQELAGKTDLSPSFLSKLESGKVGISIANLDRISNALTLDIIHLVKGPEPHVLPALFKEGSRASASLNGGILYEVLAPVIAQFGLNATRVSSQPGQSSGEDTVHFGDEFRYILTGKFRFWVGEDSFDLESGDTLCHSAETPHRWENIGDEDGTFIVVSTMPWH